MTLTLPPPAPVAAALSDLPDLPAEGLPWVLPRIAELLGQRIPPRRMLDALPHAMDATAPAAVIGAARRLGLAPRPWLQASHRLPDAVLPALWVGPEGQLALVTGRTARYLLVEHEAGAPAERVHALALPGRLYVFAGPGEVAAEAGRPMLPALVAEDAGPIAGLLALSVLSSIASIALGLVVMIAFDFVIPGRDTAVLLALAVGVALALAGDLAARVLIARGIGRLGERAERRVLGAVFEKVMHLPWQGVAAQDPALQVMRMRELEAARELFSGPLPHLLLQLPLVVLFLLTIWAVAGAVVLVPLALLPLQLLAAAVLVPRARAAERQAGLLGTERRQMMLETLSHSATLRMTGVEAAWLARFRGVSGAAAAAQARAARAAHAVETIATAGLPLAAAGMASVGAVMVIEGRISAGALVAAIMLGWRVLVPMQSFLLAASRGRQVADAVRQLHRLEGLREEARPPADAPRPALRGGALRFEGVVHRAGPDAPPVLAGASLVLAQGARVAITGPAGSGKSTLLRVAIGLVQPQGGTVTLGGVNIAQFDPAALRARIGYLPQRPALIYGTVAQNLRLAAPLAATDELATTCDELGILDDILALPDGFETRLDDIAKDRLPQSLRQGLALAQAMLRRPEILLLDDPTRALDAKREARLDALLDRLHGQVGVLLVTQRAALIRRCDAVHVLDRGSLVTSDPGGTAPRRPRTP